MKKTILIVEDEKDIRDIYKLKFKKSGYTVLESGNAQEALNILAKKNAPDIILLDLIMPGMSGYELIKQLKSDEKYKKIPIFILSNLGQDLEIKEGFRLHADKYFIKANYTPAEIVEKVNEFLKK